MENQTNALIVRGQDKAPITFDQLKSIVVETNDVALVERNKLVARAQELEQVVGDKSQLRGVELLRELKAFEKNVETFRKQIKGPVKTLADTIDSLAKKAIAPVLAEIERIGNLVDRYTNQQTRKAQEAQRVAQAEADRIERERVANAQRAEQATNAAEIARLREEDKRLREQQSQALVTKTPTKVAGTQTRTVQLYDVVDVLALVKARPDLCKIEASPSAIQKAIKDGMRECPGLANIREESKLIA